MDGPDRAAIVRRLVALEGEGRLGSEQVRLAAGGVQAVVLAYETGLIKPGSRIRVTPGIRVLRTDPEDA